MLRVSEIVRWLESFAPKSLAADWDNTGLLLGESSASVERIMTCLTITPEVVAEAVAEKVHLIVSHHPVLFKAAKTLTDQTPDGRLLLPLLKHGIAVYSPHTAFDNCIGGINDGLAKRLYLEKIAPLRNKAGTAELKLVIFVPETDLEKVSQALFAAGAGIIGHYEQCSFRTMGTGTFFGRDASNPVVGVKGRREEVPEYRLEVRVPVPVIDRAVAVMRAAHSYEEPAFDIYPLRADCRGGEGRIGELPEAVSLGVLAQLTKQALKANVVQIVGEEKRMIQRVAIACGAAGEFLKDAIAAKADAFLTGEVRFHDALAAEAAGIALILPGHYASERPGVEDLAETIASAFPFATVFASRAERDPLRHQK
jgi:dinuclear metal center YbgI/SA1388 family protein